MQWLAIKPTLATKNPVQVQQRPKFITKDWHPANEMYVTAVRGGRPQLTYHKKKKERQQGKQEKQEQQQWGKREEKEPQQELEQQTEQQQQQQGKQAEQEQQQGLEQQKEQEPMFLHASSNPAQSANHRRLQLAAGAATPPPSLRLSLLLTRLVSPSDTVLEVGGGEGSATMVLAGKVRVRGRLRAKALLHSAIAKCMRWFLCGRATSVVGQPGW